MKIKKLKKTYLYGIFFFTISCNLSRSFDVFDQITEGQFVIAKLVAQFTQHRATQQFLLETPDQIVKLTDSIEKLDYISAHDIIVILNDHVEYRVDIAEGITKEQINLKFALSYAKLNSYSNIINNNPAKISRYERTNVVINPVKSFKDFIQSYPPYLQAFTEEKLTQLDFVAVALMKLFIEKLVTKPRDSIQLIQECENTLEYGQEFRRLLKNQATLRQYKKNAQPQSEILYWNADVFNYLSENQNYIEMNLSYVYFYGIQSMLMNHPNDQKIQVYKEEFEKIYQNLKNDPQYKKIIKESNQQLSNFFRNHTRSKQLALSMKSKHTKTVYTRLVTFHTEVVNEDTSLNILTRETPHELEVSTRHYHLILVMQRDIARIIEYNFSHTETPNNTLFQDSYNQIVALEEVIRAHFNISIELSEQERLEAIYQKYVSIVGSTTLTQLVRYFIEGCFNLNNASTLLSRVQAMDKVIDKNLTTYESVKAQYLIAQVYALNGNYTPIVNLLAQLEDQKNQQQNEQYKIQERKNAEFELRKSQKEEEEEKNAIIAAEKRATNKERKRAAKEKRIEQIEKERKESKDYNLKRAPEDLQITYEESFADNHIEYPEDQRVEFITLSIQDANQKAAEEKKLRKLATLPENYLSQPEDLIVHQKYCEDAISTRHLKQAEGAHAYDDSDFFLPAEELSCQKIAENLELHFNLKGRTNKKVLDEIKANTYRFTKSEFLTFCQAMDCTISHKKHTKIKMDIETVEYKRQIVQFFRKNTKEDDQSISVENRALILPRWDKQVSVYLRPQILHGLKAMINLKILEKSQKQS